MKYIPTAITDFDNIITPIRTEFGDEKIVPFVDYYEENCGQPYALVDKTKISLVWEDPENSQRKHICIINPSSKTITLKPLDNKSSRLKASDDLFNEIEAVVKSWSLTVTPFDLVDKNKIDKIKDSKPLRIRTVSVKGNPNAELVSMPDKLIVCFKDNASGYSWEMTANYHSKNAVYSSAFENYKKKFATPEEAIVDLIKEAIEANTLPNYEIVYLKDGKDYDKKYQLEDLEQLVYQYIQRYSPTDATTIELPIYDPTNEDDIKNYIEAIKKGDLNLVKDFLKSGAIPFDAIKLGKKQRIYPFDTAIKSKQADVALLLLEHLKSIASDEVHDWMYENIEAIK